MHDQRPVDRRLIGQSTLSEPAIYEGQGTGVKLSPSNRLKRSRRLLLAGAGGVGFQRRDALGRGAAALGGTAAMGGGAIRHGAAGGSGGFRGHFRFRSQHGLDRGVRALELHGEFCDFGGDVAKLAMQLEGPNSPIEAMLAAEPEMPAKAARPASGTVANGATAHGSGPPEGGGTPAERIPALKSHASRARQQQPT